jgi:hypothetical protein
MGDDRERAASEWRRKKATSDERARRWQARTSAEAVLARAVGRDVARGEVLELKHGAAKLKSPSMTKNSSHKAATQAEVTASQPVTRSAR